MFSNSKYFRTYTAARNLYFRLKRTGHIAQIREANTGVGYVVGWWE